ncbi:DEAD-domain-containing protein [Aulographum hederae CBS 113979]|uniref:ATP-dependent RNA helicase n=1 Tax=Aulographum hederae CBS 113979 TaxID=1176131 RepID=A0A6G1H879_9PEZI|nr:DEAD-domain-containing protein [Aulographum hederae CBS 113979]
MAGVVTGRTRPTKPKKQMRTQKRKRDHVDVEGLEEAVAQLDPKDPEFSVKSFSDLPLSDPTQAGLKASHFTALTDIQSRAIPLALQGRDILGAAKTGSGKTLAFLIPVLENLYRAQCIGPDAGLGALIISPTRELAIQIFEVLRKLGRKGHMFAAGLLIGGKNLKEEQDALARMNILVCTPGRILQHLSQTANFDVYNLRMLVLDEADRILDMGFQHDVDAIIQYLPPDRQTLLFSATQTKRVQDLARLSLKDPEYIAVHEAASHSTPSTLQQNYVITPLPQKLDTLWSFLQTTKKNKTIVFLSSGKQVRFVYESFRRMQPGVPLLHLHGGQKQAQRLDITERFSTSKASCLFATDIAARGLDFPAVDWVVQVDCPEDSDTYVHRVGRTARYQRAGRAVLFLDPSEEEGMLQRLEEKKVPIEKIGIKQKKQSSIKDSVQNMCFQDPQLKYLGQKAFGSYVRSIYLQKDKEVFKLKDLALEEYAASLGLPGAPRIKFLKGDDAKARKNASRQAAAISSDEEDEAEGDGPKKAKEKDKVRTKHDRMFERRNTDILADHYANLKHDSEEDDASEDEADAFDGRRTVDDGFLTVKRHIPADPESDFSASDEEQTPASEPESDPHDPTQKSLTIPGAKNPILVDSKRREALLKSKKKLLKLKDKGTKLVFDDEGNARPLYELEDEEAFKARGKPEMQRERFVEMERGRVEEVDREDKARAKERRREKVRKRKERERREVEGGGEADDDGEVGPGVGAAGDAFADFVADAAAASADEESERTAKRPKKWFEDGDSDDEAERKRRKKRGEGRKREEPIETLEDMEALAMGLLN